MPNMLLQIIHKFSQIVVIGLQESCNELNDEWYCRDTSIHQALSDSRCDPILTQSTAPGVHLELMLKKAARICSESVP